MSRGPNAGKVALFRILCRPLTYNVRSDTFTLQAPLIPVFSGAVMFLILSIQHPRTLKYPSNTHALRDPLSYNLCNMPRVVTDPVEDPFRAITWNAFQLFHTSFPASTIRHAWAADSFNHKNPFYPSAKITGQSVQPLGPRGA